MVHGSFTLPRLTVESLFVDIQVFSIYHLLQYSCFTGAKAKIYIYLNVSSEVALLREGGRTELAGVGPATCVFVLMYL